MAEITPEQHGEYLRRMRHCQGITKTDDSKARRAAEKAGLRIIKSRQQTHINNYGGYQIVNDRGVVAGTDFDLNAQDVIDFCEKYKENVRNTRRTKPMDNMPYRIITEEEFQRLATPHTPARIANMEEARKYGYTIVFAADTPDGYAKLLAAASWDTNLSGYTMGIYREEKIVYFVAQLEREQEA